MLWFHFVESKRLVSANGFYKILLFISSEKYNVFRSLIIYLVRIPFFFQRILKPLNGMTSPSITHLLSTSSLSLDVEYLI